MSVIDKVNKFVDSNIIKSSFNDIVSDRFSRYSKYIIQERALPDVRDGLKPVQRRILYAMYELGMFSNKPYKKSARIAGEVMGKYHPHGDSSIYEAMVRMSQDFKMLVPLIDMHGNNGSIDGDSPAAMRYTEARLAKAAEYLLEDIDKRTVLFVPNFDDEETEPVVLPAKFPNLLVNGSVGIAAGYATKIPPHNLNEVINATIAYLKNPNISEKDLLKYIKGPDFPTGGIVQGLDGIKDAMSKGAGRIIIRAKVIKEDITRTQDRLVITEIPYEVVKADLVRQIDMLRVDKTLEDIQEVRDESDQEGLRIAIDLKRGADYNVVLAYLYKNTNLQVSYNYNMVAIVNNRPEQIGVLPILKAYIDHQKEVVTNRSNYLLDRARRREHIVLGLIKMVSILDQVIHTIRESNNKANAKENIMARFSFSEQQAEAIVTLQLYRLSNTDINDLEMENQALKVQIAEFEKILTNEKVLNEVIESELKLTQKELGAPRKTEIEAEIETIRIDERELISEENVVVGITKEGYVVRSNLRSYSSTRTPGLKQGDSFMFEEEVSTLDTLLLFTNLGNYIFLPVFKLEEQRWGDLGIYINNIVPIQRDEVIIKTLKISDFKTTQELLLATKSGMMKLAKLSDFEVSRYTRPIRAMRLNKGDELVSVDIDILSNIVCLTEGGYSLRFKTIELPQYGLQAAGVKSMLLQPDDYVRSAFFAEPEDEIVILTSRGHIIKESAEGLPLYNRYRRGVLIIDRLKSNPHLIRGGQRLSRNQVREDVEVNIICEKGSMKKVASDLKYSANKYGRNVVEDDLGEPYELQIKPAFADEIKTTKPAPQAKANEEFVETKILAEEIQTKDNKTIKISKFDLFDD
ncbi:MAG: DNA topoisomerase IV subunit A [Acholeplasmataceae bacterium]|jgi:topoisomerase-4 subunit A|nr:DNA topoisomerase IV subunit A [Acholeplasmataceae bacterium]